MRPRTTPIAAYTECADVAAARDAIASNREIAQRYYISESYVRHLIKLARKGKLLSEGEVSRGTSAPPPNIEQPDMPVSAAVS